MKSNIHLSVNVSFFVNGCKGTTFFRICKRLDEKNIIFFLLYHVFSELA